MNASINVIAVVGPTASGKTALSIELARALNGEIINGDAMQVYKEVPWFWYLGLLLLSFFAGET